jgi:hypothetical protein
MATGMKWTDLVKRSTMTHIDLYPREVRGKPTMKSMQMSPISTQEYSRVAGFQRVSNDLL